MGAKSFFLGLLLTLAGLAPSPATAQTNTQNRQVQAREKQIQESLDAVPTVNPSSRADSLSAKAKLAIVQANLAKAKSDAAELAALARELREELNKPGVDALSFAVVNRADKIGKLAKKIREETRAF